MVFLDINEAATALDDDAAFELVMDVAEQDLPVVDIAARLLVMRARDHIGG